MTSTVSTLERPKHNTAALRSCVITLTLNPPAAVCPQAFVSVLACCDSYNRSDMYAFPAAQRSSDFAHPHSVQIKQVMYICTSRVLWKDNKYCKNKKKKKNSRPCGQCSPPVSLACVGRMVAVTPVIPVDGDDRDVFFYLCMYMLVLVFFFPPMAWRQVLVADPASVVSSTLGSFRILDTVGAQAGKGHFEYRYVVCI